MFIALLSRVGQYDLVHLNSLVYSHAAYAYRAARWRGVPVVVTPHVEIGQKVTYALGWQSRILEGSDHVIAVTQGERDFLLELGLDPWRVTTAGNGLHVDSYPTRDMGECRRRLGLPADAFVLLFLGRQVRYKGLDATLEAFTVLRRRYPHLYFVVAGPETDFSRRLFSNWQEQPRVINLGRVSDDVRIDVLNACDCLVLPSAGEAFGIVFLEAWIFGKPVIGPRTLAISTLIEDGRDGWLVPVSDPLAIAEVLVRWLDAPLLAQEMGACGREKVLSRYTWPHIADIIEGVCFRTLRTRRRVRKVQVSRHVSG
jgi:glycosyltransferase involved in cell wall biosynthesis